MSEPLYALQARDERVGSLWERAPAWRGLIVTASLFTLGAVALPLLLPQAGAPHIAGQRAVQHVAAKAPALAPVAPVPSPPALAVHSPAPSPLTMPARVASARAPAHVIANPTPATIVPQAAPVCSLRQTATTPVLVGTGTVVGFEDRAEALANIQVSESTVGGKIDPAYIDNQRVWVNRPNGVTRAFILPKGLSVQIGDRVILQNGYRNLALPCNYVPVMIASDFGPAPANATSAGVATGATPPSQN